MSKSINKVDEQALNGLARKIVAAHAACGASWGTALTSALSAGELLSEAKASLPHGKWLSWLGENCRIPDRTARVYMRLHEHRGELESKSAESANLRIDSALKMLSTSKKQIKKPAAAKTKTTELPIPAGAKLAPPESKTTTATTPAPSPKPEPPAREADKEEASGHEPDAEEDIVRDGMDRPVEDPALHDAFRNAALFDEALNLHRQLVTIVNKILGKEKRMVGGEFMADGPGERQLIEGELKGIHVALKYSRPYAPCPHPLKNHERCDACKGRRWVTLGTWENAPKSLTGGRGAA